MNSDTKFMRISFDFKVKKEGKITGKRDREWKTGKRRRSDGDKEGTGRKR